MACKSSRFSTSLHYFSLSLETTLEELPTRLYMVKSCLLTFSKLGKIFSFLSAASRSTYLSIEFSSWRFFWACTLHYFAIYTFKSSSDLEFVLYPFNFSTAELRTLLIKVLVWIFLYILFSLGIFFLSQLSYDPIGYWNFVGLVFSFLEILFSEDQFLTVCFAI